MLRALPYCVFFSLCFFLLFFYLGNYQPQAVTDMLMQVDVFGWTKTVQDEKKRLYKIDNLTVKDNGKEVPLSYDEKQVLINRTVFMGATPEMVVLALGDPIKITTSETMETNGNKLPQLIYVYYLLADKRPTFFVFKDNKLIDAYKGSALDVK